MDIGEGLYIIWLDTHIGVIGQYQTLKEQFRSNLQPVVAMPPGNINELICYFEENIAPIHFVSTIDDALSLIQYEKDKKIVFISSGSLGKEIIPTIISNYTHVRSFYIFCGYVKGLVDWAMDRGYDQFMQILDHENDLLVRLARDASEGIIKLGQSYMALKKGESARKCFVTAETLEIYANEFDRPRPPLRSRLKLLQGENGLIQQARDMAQQS